MKKNISIILSLIAIVLAVTMFVLWIWQVKDFAVVSLDTFIGVMVAILGVLVTIIVGYQIVNALDIKNTLKENSVEMQNKMAKHEAEIQSKLAEIEQLKNIVKEQDVRFQKEIITAKYDLAISGAQNCLAYKDYAQAALCALAAIDVCLEMTTPRDIRLPFAAAQEAFKHLRGALMVANFYTVLMNAHRHIQNSPNYVFIKGEYEATIVPALKSLKVVNVEE